MKKVLFMFLICFIVPVAAISQIDISKKIKDRTIKRADRRTDQGIDKGLDAAEQGIKNVFTGDKDNDESRENDDKKTSDGKKQNSTNESETTENSGDKKRYDDKDEPKLNWAKYDFIPGDKVIFEDNQENEENGEFPSRWDLVKGVTEIADFGGESVIMFRGGGPTIVPNLKNSDKDYLPDVFTVELDLYIVNSVQFTINLWDAKNQDRPSGSSTAFEIWPKTMGLYPSESSIPENGSILGRWAHIAIAFTNGKIKGYIDDTRLINIPHLNFNPTGISLHAYHASDENRYYVRNIRIAEGGVKYYDRVLQEGKIISTGIRFDVGKATLKPESMGVINEICDLMKEHTDLKFNVEGHTDSDGDNDSNQKLSEARAETVMNTMIKMGISKDRLSSKGYGESKPIHNNDTAEGKANNRRVEFVKI